MNTWARTFLLGIGAILLRPSGIKSSGLLIVGNWVSSNLWGIGLSIVQNWVVGWTTRRIIGVLSAFVFVSIYKNEWSTRQKLDKPIIFILITTAFPLFVTWPALGFGFAFSKTPIRFTLVSKAIIRHLIYGDWALPDTNINFKNQSRQKE